MSETAASWFNNGRSRWMWAAFPAAVLLAMLVLVGLNLNGSSISLFSSGADKPGLLAGTPRVIRSDEWSLQTPIAISAVQQGLPDRPWIGLSRIDQAAVTHRGPTTDWTALFKPQDWGFLLLGGSRGLATSWWSGTAVGLIGCFAFFGMLTRRPVLSAALATAAVFTPYGGWWSAPSPDLLMGYAALAGACMLAAWTVRRRVHAVALAVTAGMSGVALMLVLYPPWQVSLGLVVMATCVGFAIDARVGWARFLWPLFTAAGTAALLLGIWFAQHKEAIAAQAATYYPGHRVSSAGTGSLAAFLDAPLNFWMTGAAGATVGQFPSPASPNNLSEAASSWLPLPLAILLVLGVVELVVRAVRRRNQGDVSTNDPSTRSVSQRSPGPPPVWTLAAVSAVVLLLVAWALLDLPSIIGKITLLQRVPPMRTPLAIGFGLITLFALTTRVTARRPVAWSPPFLAVGAAATVLATTWADAHLSWDDRLTPLLPVVLSALVVAVAFAGLLHRPLAVVAALVLAIYAAVSWSLINPLQSGTAPIAQDALVRRLQTVTKDDPNKRVAVFGADVPSSFLTIAKVRAAGLQSISGTTFYPDATLMRALVPDQKPLWNNYAQYVWRAAPAGAAPTITQIRGTLMSLDLPVCDPVILEKVDPGWIVSDKKLDASCVDRASVLRTHGRPRTWIYRVVS